MIKGLASQTWVHVLVGAALMGGWAFFANRGYAIGASVQAALLQGGLSAFLTACLKTVADRLQSTLAHWWMAAAASLMFSATLLMSAHWLAATPELAATVAVPLLVSGTYIFGYCYLKRRPTGG